MRLNAGISFDNIVFLFKVNIVQLQVNIEHKVCVIHCYELGGENFADWLSILLADLERVSFLEK